MQYPVVNTVKVYGAVLVENVNPGCMLWFQALPMS
jgi:hypothetical protein